MGMRICVNGEWREICTHCNGRGSIYEYYETGAVRQRACLYCDSVLVKDEEE